MVDSNLGKVAVCIAGAGSRGIRVYGMIKAFTEAGLEYDFLSGTSSGSLNGALWHQGDLEALCHLWMNITNDKVFNTSIRSLLNGLTDLGSFKDSAPLRSLLHQVIKPSAIKANPKPFLIHTKDVTNDQEMALLANQLADDEIADFLLASCSVPLAFPPVTFRGRMLVDGGVVNNYGILSAVGAGADTIIAMIPASRDSVVVHNAKDMLDMTLHSLMECQLSQELQAIQLRNSIAGYRKIKVIVVRPQIKNDIGFLDFNSDHDTKLAMIDQGYKLAQEALKQLA